MPVAAVRHTVSLPLRPAGDHAGSLRLGVVADTHSQPHADTKRHLATFAPDALLHAGDIGDLEVLADLETVAPLHAVRGNIDTRAHTLPDDLIINVVDGADPDAVLLRIFITHIAVFGPKLRADVARRARKEGASLVVCGHSHVPFIGMDKTVPSAPLTIFNPGSVGPRRFSLPILFGTMEISRRGLRLAHVDCETGRAWQPPG